MVTTTELRHVMDMNNSMVATSTFHCRICNSDHDNPKRMRAHLRSSCHERATAAAAEFTRRLVFRNDVRAELALQLRVDPWSASLKTLHAEIESEFAAAPWTIMEHVREMLAVARRRHRAHMQIWWTGVTRSLILPSDLRGLVSEWLVDPPRKRPRPPRLPSFTNGNLKLRNYDSMEAFRRRTTSISYPVRGLENMTQTVNVMCCRCATRMDCDSSELARVELRVANMRISSILYDARRNGPTCCSSSSCGLDTSGPRSPTMCDVTCITPGSCDGTIDYGMEL